MRNLLVRGAAGFIGANFVRHWRRQYPQDVIVVLHALTYAAHRKRLFLDIMMLPRPSAIWHFRLVRYYDSLCVKFGRAVKTIVMINVTQVRGTR